MGFSIIGERVAPELVGENEYLTVFIPPTQRAFVFRVKSIVNKGAERFYYGPLPLKAGEVLSTYEGTTVTVPEDGVLPARSYTPLARTIPTSLPVYDPTDLWYVPEEYRERIFHVIYSIIPDFVRVDAQIPIGTIQGRFQREKVTVGVDKDFGFARGVLEMIHLPKIHVGFRWGNDTNADLRTGLEMVYREYVVEIPDDVDLIWDILMGYKKSKWWTMPIAIVDPTLREAFQKTYGFEGFLLYTLPEKEKALADYKRCLEVSLI
jgi:hypothetical protein